MDKQEQDKIIIKTLQEFNNIFVNFNFARRLIENTESYLSSTKEVINSPQTKPVNKSIDSLRALGTKSSFLPHTGQTEDIHSQIKKESDGEYINVEDMGFYKKGKDAFDRGD